MSFKKGNKHTDETKNKIRLAHKGKKFSDEWRKNLSIAHRGQISWRKGKKFVDEKVSKEKRLAYMRIWREKNHNKILENGRIWQEKNRKKLAAQARLRYRKNPQKELDRIRFKKYNITGDEFRTRIVEQNEKCPICKRNIKKNLSIDHDHFTGKIRGIICNDCNLAIGNAENSPERLRAMANYLEKII